MICKGQFFGNSGMRIHLGFRNMSKQQHSLTSVRLGTLLKLAELNTTLQLLGDSSLEPLQINILDYLLGIGDLTGELMRLAIGRISDGEIEFAEKICQFVCDSYRELSLISPLMDDNSEMKKKMETMLQSLVKTENACFSVHVIGSEYGGSNSHFSFSVPDLEV